MRSVDPATGKEFVNQYGIFAIAAGYLDFVAALACSALAPNGTAESPAAAYDDAAQEATLVCGQAAIWGRNDTKGFIAIWGCDSVDKFYGQMGPLRCSSVRVHQTWRV